MNWRIGEQLRKWRKKAHKSQTEAGQAIGVTRQAIGYWESGYRDISVMQFIALAKAYNISPLIVLDKVLSSRHSC